MNQQNKEKQEIREFVGKLKMGQRGPNHMKPVKLQKILCLHKIIGVYIYVDPKDIICILKLIWGCHQFSVCF